MRDPMPDFRHSLRYFAWVFLSGLWAGWTTPAHAADWSGVITIQETMTGPEADPADRRELDAYIRELRQRLSTVRSKRLTAKGPLAQVLAQDDSALSGELDQAIYVRGGSLVVSAHVVLVAGQRLRWDGDGGRVLLDGPSRRAWLVLDGGSTARPTQAVPPPLTLTHNSTNYSLSFNGENVLAQIDPRLPNPFAVGILPPEHVFGGDLGLALATLPGMPIQVRFPGRNQRTLTLSASAAHIDPRRFTRP